MYNKLYLIMVLNEYNFMKYYKSTYTVCDVETPWKFPPCPGCGNCGKLGNPTV